jgi:hypothetical protein
MAANDAKYVLKGKQGLFMGANGSSTLNRFGPFFGTAATRAAVRAQVGDDAPIGSFYVGQTSVATTKPNCYIKVLNVPGDTDWERIVVQASD